MPSGLKRHYGAGHLHYITCACYHRQRWLASRRRRDLFLQVFERVRQRYDFVVVGYVVMPDHIHLLINEPEKGNPSRVMQALKQGFARRVLRQLRKRRVAAQGELFAEQAEHVWQRRFYDFNVWSEQKRVEKLRYMHRNPVRCGLVAKPEEWAWSSFRSYACGEDGAVKINQWGELKVRVREKVA
jgi:putative transposase